ncbi:DUF2634 domain-containing protein [Fusobacterium necrophorum]|uniref:DUF2634 domain-containing protein n=1 Tax=Fusobacterium necrophorum TaxID=859 RepID=UPI00078941AE|nr:DUF2634 domain-containing protein [Fusobacterium necrophorum]KYM44599.1 terminase [Fusobacterium necrophorum subsp. funduliforme]KYM50889.1 terminase [Fusobacterium necrophorum subsp. funduliforme]
MDSNFDLFIAKQQEVVSGTELPLFCEYAIDFESGQPLYENEDIVTLIGNEALKVWIFRALKTERNRYAIHSEYYGSDLREHIGTIYNESIKQVLMQEQIKDCLLVNPYLANVYNFSFEKQENDVKITFSVDTVYGTLEQEVQLGY